jgi:hypothetical protein
MMGMLFLAMTLLATVVIAWTTDDYLPDAATAPGVLHWPETGACRLRESGKT